METWFSEGLIRWYKANKRDLPWRHESDPYKIWLSEIILQQTQVIQGLSYYNRFTSKYPSVKQLANAPEDDVLKLWQGLGYYSRARNLHSAAKTILSEHKGRFPERYEDIRALKGVGDYTASAIASFAYGLPYAVVDGNVYRVLSRVFGVNKPIDSGPAKKEYQELANQLLDKKQPAIYNQAIMEFGSQYCKPVNPDCGSCIFKSRCYAFKMKMVDKLPFKEKKTKVKPRYFNYFVVVDKNDEVLVQRREGKDIWQGLYQFPLLETPEETTMEKLLAQKELKTLIGEKPRIIHHSRLYKHVLSHQHLFARFYVIRPSVKTVSETSVYQKSKTDELERFAFPRLIVKFLGDCGLKEML